MIRDLRFPRRVRLVDAAAYKAVFEGARRRSSSALTLLARINTLGHARLGIVVGKKQEKSAVGRNRVKRLIRESFRHHQELLSGLDLVVLVRRPMILMENKNIFTELARQWQAIAQCKK